MESKKALLVLPGFGGGGAERSIVKYAQELTRAGYRVIVVALTDRVDFTLPPDAFERKILPDCRWRLRFIRRRIQGRQLRRLVESLGGLQSFSIKLSTLPESDKVVFLLNDNGFIFRFANDYHGELRKRKFLPMMRSIKRFRIRRRYMKSKVLCVSEGVAEGARSLLNREDDRIRTIYNPFHFDTIVERSRAADPDIPSVPYIIHVGRAARQKRHDLLIEAYKRSGVTHKLVLLGKTRPRERALVEDAGLQDKVIFIDYKDNPYPLIASASALVLSSDREGLPGVLIESLICGTPVVSTRCDYGPSEILTGSQARFLVPTGDADALATAIKAVLADPPDLAQVDLDKFRADGFVRKLEQLAAAS